MKDLIRNLWLPLSMIVVWTPVILQTGCQEAAATPSAPTAMIFEALFDQKPWSCGEASAAGFDLLDLRLFVHDVEVEDEWGAWSPLDLVADGRWQTATVALLDFADDSGSCQSSPSTRNRLLGHLPFPIESAQAVRFSIGVPKEPNHDNPALAAAPLSAGQMHWSWQSGYKFCRLEARQDETRLRLHLGSTHCEGPLGAVESCGRANRARIQAPVSAGVVRLDFGQLFRQLVPMSEAARDGACLAGARDKDCLELYPTLGLDHRSGATVAVSEVFNSKERPS